MTANATQRRRAMRQQKKNACPIDGGNHTLNFINTLRKQEPDEPLDHLASYEDLVAWCHDAGVIPYEHYNQLSLEGYCYAKEAEEVLTQAHHLRTALTGILWAAMEKQQAEEFFLREFNRVLQIANQHTQYINGAKGLKRIWTGLNEELAGPLWLLADSAAWLLSSGKMSKVKKCPICGSLFLDATKNSQRTWCNPATCGMVEKRRRYYLVSKN